jgi:hypothetical protein
MRSESHFDLRSSVGSTTEERPPSWDPRSNAGYTIDEGVSPPTMAPRTDPHVSG